MASTTMETTALAAFTLPGSPHSARMARFYIRAALTYHGLGGYADDAETVASELIANAVTHAPAPVVTLALTWLERSRALGIVVTDSSPLTPVKRDPGKDNEHRPDVAVASFLGTRGQGPQRRRRTPAPAHCLPLHRSPRTRPQAHLAHDLHHRMPGCGHSRRVRARDLHNHHLDQRRSHYCLSASIQRSPTWPEDVVVNRFASCI
jgi:hypothetical protein